MNISKQTYTWLTQRRPGLGSVMSLVLCLLVGLLSVACGVSIAPGQTGQSPDETPGHTPISAVSPSATPTQLPAQGVTLSSDRGAYSPTSTIIVTLANRGSSSIFAPNHQTGCTILTLQRETSSDWQPVGRCALGILTHLVEVRAGETMRILLAPGAGEFRPTPWPTGTYHAVLRYTLDGQATEADTIVATANFIVA